MAERGGDEVAAEAGGGSGEVVGGDFGELLFDEDEGAEVEALDFGAGFHVVAGDGSAEGGDEGLRVEGVVGGGFAVLGEGGWRAGGVVGEGRDFGFEVEADGAGVGGAGGGFGVGFAGAVGVVVGVEGDEVEELLGVGGDVGADEVFVFGEGYGYGREGEVVFLLGELRGGVCRR